MTDRYQRVIDSLQEVDRQRSETIKQINAVLEDAIAKIAKWKEENNVK